MSSKRKVTTLSISAALAAATLIPGSAVAQSSKEGGSVPPVRLELAVADYAESGLIEIFADRVQELSDGSLQVDIDWEGGQERVVPTRVQGGDVDLGWVATRGLNLSGVSDFDALLTPFLVSDIDLLDAIISGSIGADMLAGLADDGLEGLALLPGYGRYFVGLGHPLATLADFDGARMGGSGRASLTASWSPSVQCRSRSRATTRRCTRRSGSTASSRS